MMIFANLCWCPILKKSSNVLKLACLQGFWRFWLWPLPWGGRGRRFKSCHSDSS